MIVELVLVMALHIGAVLSMETSFMDVHVVTNSSLQPMPESRIYGGLEAKDSQFPYMVFVVMKRGDFVSSCSASLITPKWVLLAAHCFDLKAPTESIVVVGGQTHLKEYVTWKLGNFKKSADEKRFQLQERQAEKFYINPDYSSVVYIHDTALLELKTPFIMGKIQTIPLSEEKMVKKTKCTILGWGFEPSGHKYRLNYIENKLVAPMGDGCRFKNNYPLLCLMPDERGICSGDSGSPLVCGGKVWGVASHLISLKEKPRCGVSDEEYYAELYEDLSWVKSIYEGAASLPSPLTTRSALACAFLSFWLSQRV